MDKKDTKKVVISLSLPVWMVETIRRRAYFMDISISAYVKNILAEAITGGKDNGNS